MHIWSIITLSNVVITSHMYLLKLKLINEIKLKIQFPNITSHTSSAGSHTQLMRPILNSSDLEYFTVQKIPLDSTGLCYYVF